MEPSFQPQLLLVALYDNFTEEAFVAHSSVAECSRGTFAAETTPVLIWRSHQTISPRDQEARRVLDHIGRIAGLEMEGVVPVQGGIDSEGVPFLVIKPLFGEVLGARGYEPREAERRFTLCVRRVMTMHAAGLVLGDLGPGSFWITRDGGIALLGILGVHRPVSVKAIVTKHYHGGLFLAPEVLQGEPPTAASDVFSLGVLLALFFAGTLPSSMTEAEVLKISRWRDPIPAWVLPTVLRCLNPQPGERFPTARALLNSMAAVKQEMIRNGESVVVANRVSAPAITNQPTGDYSGSGKNAVLTGGGGYDENLDSNVGSKRSSPPKWLHDARLGLVVLVGAIALGVALRSIRSGFETSDSSQVLADRVNAVSTPLLQQAVRTIIEGGDKAGREAALQTVLAAKDPGLFSALAQAALDAKSIDGVSATIALLFEQAKMKRTGNLFAAEVARYRSAVDGTTREEDADLKALPASFITAINPMVDAETRTRAVYDSFLELPTLTLEALTSLVLDALPQDQYSALVQEVVGTALNREDLRRLSGFSLLIIHPDTAAVVGKNAVDVIEKIPAPELTTVIEYLAGRNDPLLASVASVAAKADSFSPVAKIFLSGLQRERSQLTIPMALSLVRGLKVQSTEDDIRTLIEWDDALREQVLFGIALTSESPVIANKAFDAVTSRSVAVDSVKRSIEWLNREGRWPERHRFTKLLAAIALADIVSSADLRHYADQAIGDRESGLLRVLLASGTAPVASALISQFGVKLGLREVLPLLSHADRGVRLASIDLLKEYDDLSMLRIITDKFDSETDAEVRAQYRRAFPAIDERERKREAADAAAVESANPQP